ncbi:MAG: multicopper oxidase domain-containing protein [Acidobacteriaceae bacterium]|nr:multicopper oxidase domain-containing protein [Acidobacteriaceae bacterium]
MAPKLLDPETLAPFVDALPIPPLARSSGGRYRLAMRDIEQKVHRDVPPTRFWAFGQSVPGPTIEARSGEAVTVEWANELPARHFLPIDHNLMGAEADKPEVRAIVHLHGGRVPPASDGYPENWYAPGRSQSADYPNRQEAALLWYHDHAMGITRLNNYAGLFGLYVVRDAAEDALGLPRGEFEIPLAIFDRFLEPDGQLYYPASQWAKAPWVPEFFGNSILVNGKLLPYLEVEARLYRFRLLNASNARFFRLSLANGQSFWQIGTDQGLLAAPVELKRLAIAPGERADLLIDFGPAQGAQVVLRNEVYDVMQFRVGKTVQSERGGVPATLAAIERPPEASAARAREMTLEEYDDVLAEPMTHLLNGKRWRDPVTENPVVNTTEIWSLINLTDDAHPIHLHLVRFQILDRRPFDVTEYLLSKKIRYVGEAFPPEPNEAGWKDTVKATPGAVTRIIVKFEHYTGRYVWHCHILEHEDNEMMRPYDVLPGTPQSAKPESAG